MKYWTLFTLRIMARLGLAAVVLCWWLPASVRLSGGIHSGPRLVALTVHELGWQLAIANNVSGPSKWWVVKKEIQNPAVGVELLSKTVPASSRIVPGVYFRRTPSWYQNLCITHWLLCLTFLVATVATWPRKKPAPVQENDT